MNSREWAAEHERLSLIYRGYQFQPIKDPGRRAARQALLAHNLVDITR